jgi:CheY-like chemotaxis protein
MVPAFEPDLVLLDVMMPEMNGVETFRSLKQIPQCAETPMIFITAKAQKHEIELYKAIGAIEVIPKPFDPVALPGEILGIWARTQTKQTN